MKILFQPIKLIALFLILSFQFSAIAGTTISYTFTINNLSNITDDVPDDISSSIDYVNHTTSLPIGNNLLFSFENGNNTFMVYYNNKGGRIFFSRNATYNNTPVVSLYTLFNTKVRMNNGNNLLNFTVSDNLIWVTTANGNGLKTGNGDGEGILFVNDMNLFDNTNASTTFGAYSLITSFVRDPNPTPIARTLITNEDYLYDEYDYDIIDQPDQLGNALSFDGTKDYVSLPAGTYFNGIFTIEAQVYPRSFNYWSRVIDFGNGPRNNNVLLSIASGSNGYPTLAVGGSQLQSNILLLLNQWNHVAVTFDGTTATIFINGVNAGTAGTATVPFPTPANVTRNNCYIGKSNWDHDGYANATMDEVRIWNIARSQADIQANMNIELADITQSGLVAYYQFNQGIPCGDNTNINTVTNSTSTNNAGTLMGFNKTSTVSNFVPGLTPGSEANICVGDVQELTNDVSGGTWSSSNTNIATVNDGFVTGVGAGNVVISYVWSNGNSCNSTSATAFVVNAIPVVAQNTGIGVSNVSNALHFDGTNDFVSFANGYSATSELTYEAWVNVRDFSEYNTIINHNSWAAGYVHFQFNKGILQFGINPSIDSYCSFTFSKNTWYHVAAVYSSITGTVKFYVNGQLTNTVTNPSSPSVSGGLPFTIGSWNNDRFFNGKMDEIRIWNYARSQAQILSTLNSELGGREPGLMAYYDFNQGSAGSVTNLLVRSIFDKTENVRHGSLTNFDLYGSTSNFVTGVGLSEATPINIGGTFQINNSTPSGIWSTDDETIATVNSSGLVKGVAVGTISIDYTVTNASGCSTTSSTSVVVNCETPSEVPITATLTTICPGKSVNLYALLPIGYTCKWATTANGTSLGTNNSLTVTPSSTTTYYLTVTNNCGSSATSSVTISVLSTTMTAVTTPLTAKQIAVAFVRSSRTSGTTVTGYNRTYAILNDDKIYYWTGASWTKISDTIFAYSLAIQSNGTLWWIGKGGTSDYKVFSTVCDINGSPSVDITSYPVNAYKVTCGFNNDISVILRDPVVNGAIGTFNGTNFILSYRYISAFDIAIDANRRTWYVQNGLGNPAFYFNQGTTTSTSITPTGFRLVAAGKDGSVFFTGLASSSIYQWNGSTAATLVSSFGNANTDLAVYDATTVITINNGVIYKPACFIGSDIVRYSTPSAALRLETLSPIEEDVSANSILIFPNPTNGKVTVQLVDGMENANISVINTLGMTIAEDNNDGLLRTLNLQGKPSGVYVVKITDKNGTVTAKKVILE